MKATCCFLLVLATTLANAQTVIIAGGPRPDPEKIGLTIIPCDSASDECKSTQIEIKNTEEGFDLQATVYLPVQVFFVKEDGSLVISMSPLPFDYEFDSLSLHVTNNSTTIAVNFDSPDIIKIILSDSNGKFKKKDSILSFNNARVESFVFPKLIYSMD